MRQVAAITLGLSLAMWAASTEAQSLREAIGLESEGRLEDALDAFESVLASDGNSRRDLSVIYEHLAVLRFAAGDSEGAQDAFLRMLAVAPTASMPASAPPDMQPLFDQAEERWAGRTLHAEIEERAVVDGELVLDVRVIDDLLEMVGGVQIARGSTRLVTGRGYGPHYELNIPSEDWGDDSSQISVRLVNVYGGIIWEGTHRLEAPEEGAVGPRGTPRRPLDRSQRVQRIVAYSLLGVGLATTAVGIALVAVDESATGTWQVIDGIMHMQVRNTDVGGWVLIGLGGAAAIGSMIWLLLIRAGGLSADRARRLASGTISRW